MSEKKDVYERITEKIIIELENGVLPWVQPWQAGHAAGAVSRPLRSVGIPYRGINVLMLWLTALERNYDCPIWMTYKQAQELGGQVRKGEKGTLVVYASSYNKVSKNDEGEDVEEAIRFMKGYTVFNAEQVDQLPPHFYARVEPIHKTPLERKTHLEQFFAATGAEIRHGGSRAFYRITDDYIQMPELQSFQSIEGYYATAAHELTHWTGHKSRLDRNLIPETAVNYFKDKAMEELVAEIGASFLCVDFGIAPEPRPNQVAYINSWLGALQQDKKAIFRAASHAQRAVDYLQGLQPKMG